ncbi:MAG: hypothetical protein ACE5KS_03075 [Woeseiaceae bacterium]
MSRQALIRRQILGVLAYPRQVAMANVDLSVCPHSGFYNSMDPRCIQCAKNYECEWLNSTDEFNDLAEKPMEFLYRALAFGIDYVDAHSVRARHDIESCDCDSCEWVRDARDLAIQYEQRAT